jgi:hypothetical protein
MASRIMFDYDSFDYGDEAKKLSLADAIREASRLAAEDADNFYRVVPSDRTMRSFRIEKVSKEKAFTKQYASFASKMAKAFTHSSER